MRTQVNDWPQVASLVNTLAAWCGPRDVDSLTKDALQARYGFPQADVMALFGGSIYSGVDVLAAAMRAGAARHYVIVGGHGHTTDTLRTRLQAACPGLDTTAPSEAELFSSYLFKRYGLQADALETASTNCGNNITLMLELLQQKGISCRSIILAQDATMQRRMAAGLRKHRPDWTIISYATYQATVAGNDDGLHYAADIPGMWDMDRYIQLLMGEIPRLTDGPGGYGPLGAGYIAHEDVPAAVTAAWNALAQHYTARQANPAFATAGGGNGQ